MRKNKAVRNNRGAAASAAGPSPLSLVKAFLAAAVVLVLMTATHQRNKVWHSLLSLWQDCAERSPLKSRSHNNLGNCYMLLGMRFDAIREYERAIELDSRNIEAYYNAAINLDEVGLAGKALPYYETFCKANSKGYADAVKNACSRVEELKRGAPRSGKER